MVFYGEAVTKRLKSDGGLVDYGCKGIKVTVPKRAVANDEQLDLTVKPCFNVKYELPEGYEPASPVYMIRTNEVNLKMEVQLEIQHFCSVMTEEDKQSMAFFKSPSEPQFRGSQPTYVFHKTPPSQTSFTVGKNSGVISLRTFSNVVIGKDEQSSGIGKPIII